MVLGKCVIKCGTGGLINVIIPAMMISSRLCAHWIKLELPMKFLKVKPTKA